MCDFLYNLANTIGNRYAAHLVNFHYPERRRIVIEPEYFSQDVTINSASVP